MFLFSRCKVTKSKLQPNCKRIEGNHFKKNGSYTKKNNIIKGGPLRDRPGRVSSESDAAFSCHRVILMAERGIKETCD